MAKKRKAPGAARTADGPTEDPSKRVRLDLDTFEDVAGSDDEFHIGRDKVLLDENPKQRRARKVREEEEFLEASEDEVLGYSDEDDRSDLGSDDDDAQYGDAATAKGNGLRHGSDNDNDSEAASDEEDELNEWGTSKQDFYGADEMETEQDALDEEAEAKRLQQKQLQAMNAADYGFDEDEWAGRKEEAKPASKAKTVMDTLPRLENTEGMSAAEKLKLLKSRNPEFEPLRQEYLSVEEEVRLLSQSRGSQVSSQRTTTKERAATAYLATLTMYFALLMAATSPTTSLNLREHPIMDTLLETRTLWADTRDLVEVEEDSESEEDPDIYQTAVEMQSPVKVVDRDRGPRKRNKKTKAQKAAAAAARAAETDRLERVAQADNDLADLDALLTRKPKRKADKTQKKTAAADEDSDLGEEELTEKALADKAEKRRSLRFYTSQIAQKSNKRGTAGRNAGGDDDIPYRERLRDRQARLNAEAARRGQSAGDDLGGSSDEEDRAQARAIRNEANDDLNGEDYYQTIASKSAGKKAGKEAFAAAKKEALLNGGRVVEEETIGEDGKRKIGYMIEKNKGLTPHRKKDVRNPRVKKRKKYEEKKKKLGSMKAVYKGGEGRGGYGGEATGIKNNLVKSRKL